jgi:hypothetical protein
MADEPLERLSVDAPLSGPALSGLGAARAVAVEPPPTPPGSTP